MFDSPPPAREPLEDGAVLLRGFALADADALVAEIGRIAETAPFRHLVVPGGHTMSVGMTNCGRVGWVSDRSGYRYDPIDPDTGKPWPPMPASFLDLASRAAAEAGFPGYDPDACLINRYEAGAKLGLHQDKDKKTRCRRSSPCLLACRRRSSGAGSGAATRFAECGSKTAM